jgi:replicative DNA helicase
MIAAPISQPSQSSPWGASAPHHLDNMLKGIDSMPLDTLDPIIPNDTEHRVGQEGDESPSHSPLLPAALTAHAAGLAIIPIVDDGSKKPLVSWRAYQKVRATEEELRHWFEGTGQTGMAVLGGATSGNLEILDIEDQEAWDGFRQLVADNGLGALLERIAAGYSERAPGGGYHLLYRAPVVAGNTKIAQRPKLPAEMKHEHDKVKVLIETRGEGGYAIIAPSHGTVHETGRPYTLERGGFATIVTLTSGEHDALLSVTRMLDQMPQPASHVSRDPTPQRPGEERPGDRFNREMDWDTLLDDYGFTDVGPATDGIGRRVLRPGGEGSSATVNYQGSDRLKMFSSSTLVPLEGTHSKFEFYSYMEHDGDFAKAARALAARYREQDAAPEEWATPRPLPRDDVPNFPTHELPDVLRGFVTALAIKTQTPDALPAFQVMAALATASAKKAVVHVSEGYTEPLNIYNCCVLDSANRKSSVVDAASEPVVIYEMEQADGLRLVIKQAQNRRRVAEKSLEQMEKKFANGVKPEDIAAQRRDMDDAVEKLDSDPDLQVPVPPRLLVDDTTPEKLTDLMAIHEGRMAHLSAEGGIFSIISGKYNKGGDNLDLFLKAYSGETIAVDRLSREAKHLKKPALTIGLAPQREVLTAAASTPGFMGRGLLYRFSFALPHSLIGSRKAGAPAIPQGIADTYHHLIRQILDLPTEQRWIHLSPSAAKAHLDFETRLEPRLGPGGDLEDIAGWGGKLAGTMVRWAGLFHMAKMMTNGEIPWNHRLAAATMEAAIRIAETFLIPHAKAAFGLMASNSEFDRATRILNVVSRWSTDRFTRRDIHQHLRTRFPKSEMLVAPLALLEEYGFIRMIPTEHRGQGRPPSPVYEINPLFRAQNTHNTHNPPREGNSEYCEYSEESFEDEEDAA